MRWTDGRRRTSDHCQKRRTRRSGCSTHRGHAHHVGVQFARTGTLERRRVARCPRRPIALESLHGAVGKASSFIRSPGCPITSVFISKPSGSFAQRRAVAERAATIRAHVVGSGGSRAGALIRSSRVPLRPAGLVSGGRAEGHRLQIAAVGCVTAAPLGGFIESSWVLRTPGLARAHSAPAVPRSVCGERRRVSRPTVSGVSSGAFGRAALAGRSNVLALSNVGVGDRSFERPSNPALQPSNGARPQSGTLERGLAPTNGRRNTGGAPARTPRAPFAAECEPLGRQPALAA